MKYLLTFTLLIVFAQFGHSQSACDNWNTIQGKSESDFTDIKRLKIYWSKRCACESGQITGGDWEYTVKLVNDNYDMYHERRNKFPNEYSHNGSLVPDRKISVNECNSDNNLHINDSGSTNCGKKVFDAKKDPKNFGNDFMFARCQCLEGVEFEEEAKKLEAAMLINYQNAQTYYGNTLGMTPLKWTDCPILQFGQNANTQKSAPTLVYTGRESDLDKLKDQYLQTFSESGSYNAYVSGENIKRIGVNMAKDFANDLAKIGKLIETTDPEALQRDFQEKIQNIQALEAKFNEESNTYFFESGQDLGNSILSKDYESAKFQAGGLLNAHLERKETERAIAEQKKKLTKEHEQKMNKLYFKLKGYNLSKKEEYLKLGAYSEDPNKEASYLALVENIDCFNESMLNRYFGAVKQSNWMINDCKVPDIKKNQAIDNKFITEDVRKSQLAEKKYAIFLENGYKSYRDAAITFASSACNTNPKAQYFIQLAEYYRDYSTTLHLLNYLSAEQIDANSLSNTHHKIVDSLKIALESEMINALEKNDLEFITSFYKLGLDEFVLIQDKDVYIYSIYTDLADALQSILNIKIERMDEKQKSSLLQKSIMLCAAYNASTCIRRLTELGIQVDFTINQSNPIVTAEKVLSEDAFKILLERSSKSSFYKEKYKNSPIHILLNASQNPKEASIDIERLINSEDFARIIDRMIRQLDKKEYYFDVINESPTIQQYLQSNLEAKEAVNKAFKEELVKAPYESKAHLFLDKNLLNFSQLPTLADVGYSEPLEFKRYNAKKSLINVYNINEQGDTTSYDTKIKLFFDKYTLAPKTNIAWFAYLSFNPELFRAVDEKYDLSKAKDHLGNNMFKTLLTKHSFTGLNEFPLFVGGVSASFTLRKPLETLIKEEQERDSKVGDYFSERKKFGVLGDFEYAMYKDLKIHNIKLLRTNFEKRHYFYSRDFSFDSKIDGEYPLFIYLNNGLQKSLELNTQNPFLMMELVEILNVYTFNYNQQDQNGNTLLHWLAQNATKYWEVKYPTKTFIFPILDAFPTEDFINSLNVNREIKNNEGVTAFKIWKEVKYENHRFPVTQSFEINLSPGSNEHYYNQSLYNLDGSAWMKSILK